MTLHVTRATTPEELEIAFALRHRVFIEELGFDRDVDRDEHDNESTTAHFLGKDVEQDKFVAVARIVIDAASRIATVGRIAVLSECRGKNYGAVLLAGAEQGVAGEVDQFSLGALVSKRGFYERCGYSSVDDKIFVEPGVGLDQMMMTKRVTRLT